MRRLHIRISVGACLAIAASATILSAAPVKTAPSDAVPATAAAAPAQGTIGNSTAVTAEPIFSPEPIQPPVATPPDQTTAASAANYALDWYSINGGGTVNATSTTYEMGASIGQSVAGEASSASYQMGIGFWYGAGGCACAPCHANPACADNVTDVLDVVATVAVAFRGQAEVQDASCLKSRTNVNCDLVTDVLDVVAVVQVAFRGGDPAVVFCDPCA